MKTKASITASFQQHFQESPTVTIKSPGRINIIGEHTDYNKGFVLPAAINKYIYVAISPREDSKLNLFSGDYNENYQFDLLSTEINAPEWAKYIIGVSQLINKKTQKVKGFNLYVEGDVPLGAGLSSSAALSCATGFAINELFSCDLSRIDIAKIGQQTEHEFIGLNCGIMDQFASVLGKENNAIKLDCKDLNYEYIPVNWSEYEILLLNTNVKHNLASTAYNDRRNSCENGVKLIQKQYSDIESVRDITIEQLDNIVLPQDKDAYTKCKFILEENARLLAASEALKNNNIEELGRLLFSAHWALSKEYEVSCAELDYLVTKAQESDFVVGARMMGGGFGGCTFNIVKKGNSQQFIEEVSLDYKNKFGFELTPIQISLGEGTSFLE